MFDFYKTFYDMGYLTEEDIHEAAKWKCITKDEHKQITGVEYAE